MITRVWRRNWLFVTVMVVHTIWGITLLLAPDQSGNSPLGYLMAIPAFGSQEMAGAAYLLAAACYLAAWFIPDKKNWGWTLLLPQQVLLMLQFFASWIAIGRGMYIDNTVPMDTDSPHLFIFVVRALPMTVSVMHTLAFFDWYVWSRYLPAKEDA